jgi:hypothetical protein
MTLFNSRKRKQLLYLESIIWAVMEKVGNSSSIPCKWRLQRYSWSRKIDKHEICNNCHDLGSIRRNN